VLVTAASRRVPLVLAFKKALADLGVRGSVVVTDVNPLSPAVHVADKAYLVPLSGDPGYLDEIETICETESIQLVVPTIDDELEIFGEARSRFLRHGVRVASSSRSTAAICNDKLAACSHLRQQGIRAAETWLPDALPAAPAFPLFVKPRAGRGGIGAFRASTDAELRFFTAYVSESIVQEFLDGPGFTIDVLCDFDGRALAIVPRERVVIRAGVIDRGRTVADPALIDLAQACTAALPFAGAVNIQCRVTAHGPTVFEINPRFSGGIPLTIAAGADFPRMLVELTLGRRLEPCIGSFVPNLWMTSYETSLFLDSDRATTLAACAGRRLEDVA
jgi:carbamoyl-phosphate synthase large subunit